MSQPRKSKGRTLTASETTMPGEALPRRAPSAKPPETRRLRAHIRLSVTTLQRWHDVVQQAIASPRSKSTLNALSDLSADMARLAENPKLDPRQFANGYEITYPDGAVRRFRLAKDAAAVMGVTLASFKVMLSKGKGAYSREYRLSDRVERWHVRRLYAERTRT